MLFLSRELTGITFACIIPLALFTRFYQRWLRKLARQLSEAKGKINNVAEETFSNIRTVKAFTNEEAEFAKFEKGNMEAYYIGRRRTFYQGLYSLLQTIVLFGGKAIVIYYCTILFKRGETTIGEVTSFLFYM